MYSYNNTIATYLQSPLVPLRPAAIESNFHFSFEPSDCGWKRSINAITTIADTVPNRYRKTAGTGVGITILCCSLLVNHEIVPLCGCRGDKSRKEPPWIPASEAEGYAGTRHRRVLQCQGCAKPSACRRNRAAAMVAEPPVRGQSPTQPSLSCHSFCCCSLSRTQALARLAARFL